MANLANVNTAIQPNTDWAPASGNRQAKLSDDFYMYVYKVQRCSKREFHDWSSCPYAHPKEKARRRDPKKYKYASAPCHASLKGQNCDLGLECPYAHSVYEYWLHPSRFKTQMCKKGKDCDRALCFFAHRVHELRFPEDTGGLQTAAAAANAAALTNALRPAKDLRLDSSMLQDEQWLTTTLDTTNASFATTISIPAASSCQSLNQLASQCSTGSVGSIGSISRINSIDSIGSSFLLDNSLAQLPQQPVPDTGEHMLLHQAALEYQLGASDAGNQLLPISGSQQHNTARLADTLQPAPNAVQVVQGRSNSNDAATLVQLAALQLSAGDTLGHIQPAVNQSQLQEQHHQQQQQLQLQQLGQHGTPAMAGLTQAGYHRLLQQHMNIGSILPHASISSLLGTAATGIGHHLLGAQTGQVGNTGSSSDHLVAMLAGVQMQHAPARTGSGAFNLNGNVSTTDTRIPANAIAAGCAQPTIQEQLQILEQAQRIKNVMLGSTAVLQQLQHQGYSTQQQQQRLQQVLVYGNYQHNSIALPGASSHTSSGTYLGMPATTAVPSAQSSQGDWPGPTS